MKRPLLFETDDYGYIEDERTSWFTPFKALSTEQITYVALITDYNSPYYSQPEMRRRSLAMHQIKDDRAVEITHTEEIAQAATLYKEIQYDHIAEQLQSQKNILDIFTQELNKVTQMGDSKQDVEKIIKATEMQQKAEKEIERLEEKVRMRIVEDSKTRGDRATSFYEIWRKKNNKN